MLRNENAYLFSLRNHGIRKSGSLNARRDNRVEDEIEADVYRAALEAGFDDEDRRNNITVDLFLDIVDEVRRVANFTAGHWIEILEIGSDNSVMTRATIAVYRRSIPFDVPKYALGEKRRLLGGVIAQLDVQRQKAAGVRPRVYVLDFVKDEYWEAPA